MRCAVLGRFQFRPSNWSMIMSQISLAFDASLMIRDEQGRYLPATAEKSSMPLAR